MWENRKSRKEKKIIFFSLGRWLVAHQNWWVYGPFKGLLESELKQSWKHSLSAPSSMMSPSTPTSSIGLDPFCHGASLRLIVGCKFEISVTAILISISWFLDVMRIVVINNIG